MPPLITSTQLLRKPLFPLFWCAAVAVLVLTFPFLIRQEGLLGLYGVVAGVLALMLIVVHPLVTFCLYFSALFFANTTLPGIPASANQILGVLFLLAGTAYALRGQAMLVPSGLLVVLLVASTYFALNAALGEDPVRGLLHMRYVLIYLVVTLMLASTLTSEKTVLALAWVVLGTTSIAALHGLWEAVDKDILQGFVGHWDSKVRIKGTAPNPIVYGWNMVYAFPFAFLLYSEMRTHFTRLLSLALGALCLFAALLTFNRQTFVYMFIVLVAAIVLYAYRNRKLLLAGLTIGAAAAAATVLPLMIRRLMTFGNLTRDWSYLERRDSYLVGMQMFREHPVFGVGLGSFPSMYKSYIPEDYPTFFVQYWGTNQMKFPDIGYLQILAEGGLVGLSLMLVLFSCLLWQAWKYRKAAVAANDTFVQNLASTAIVLLVYVFVTTAIQDTFLYPRVWLIFSIVLLLNARTLPLRPQPATLPDVQ